MADTPKYEAFMQLLHSMHELTAAEEDNMIEIVLRGSILMEHWFGPRARPAADIDVECFAKPRTRPIPEQVLRYGNPDGIGPWGEFESMVDYGKSMCRYAAESLSPFKRDPGPIQFGELENPVGGASLWTYGTPGERYLASWRDAQTNESGVLQIDIAEPGHYQLNDLPLEQIEFTLRDSTRFYFSCYSRELLLAAKLSWLIRSFGRDSSGDAVLAPTWTGEPKDLYDAFLLLTESEIDSQRLQRSLVAVGGEDELNWNQLEALYDVRRTACEAAIFENWPQFIIDHSTLELPDPVVMLRTIVDRLEPLLGDFYVPAENPFLAMIDQDPVDESNYAIYADWLEDQGDLRHAFVRVYMQWVFAPERMSEAFAEHRNVLQRSVEGLSKPWLMRFWGSRYRELNDLLTSNPKER